ncbi:MAG: hypothetical protein E7445_04075 [Ruminococcaceae bacterium]|nr:hypothetical protein [Oscillospiraceae bacterium]
MYCKKCGNSIGTNEKCPFCGTEQHNFDPFTTLGDIEPNKSYGGTKTYVNNPAIPTTKPDCFSALGDLEQSRSCFGGVHYANTDSVINSIDPFQLMGNLDGSPILLDGSGMDAPATGSFKPMDPLNGGEDSDTEGVVSHGDKPATGGFKPMDELAPSNDGQEETEETENRNPTVTFIWKKWMTIAVCCTTIICLLLCVVCSPALRFANGEFSAESAANVLDEVLDVPILEVNTEEIETPAFLYSIESRNGYEILSFKKTQTGAVATMRVFAPDVYGVAKNLDSSNTYIDANTLMDALDSALKTAPIVEKQVVVEYILTDEGYAPILTAEFLDAYYGGIYQLRDEVIAKAAVEG